MPVYQLDINSYLFPPTRLARPDGLLAVGGDLSFGRLVAAYRQGIFPWFGHGDPILWWSPTPRCVVLPPHEGGGLHLPRSLKKVLSAGKFTFTVNKAFDKVIRLCAGIMRRGQVSTWIVPEMVEAYNALHQRGVAHSVEAWQDGQLVGGLYGIAMGRAFFGESMFYTRRDASKAAFAWLAQKLFERGFMFIDCQQETEHMLRFGAEMLPRRRFEELREQALAQPDEIEFFGLQN